MKKSMRKLNCSVALGTMTLALSAAAAFAADMRMPAKAVVPATSGSYMSIEVGAGWQSIVFPQLNWGSSLNGPYNTGAAVTGSLISDHSRVGVFVPDVRVAFGAPWWGQQTEIYLRGSGFDNVNASAASTFAGNGTLPFVTRRPNSPFRAGGIDGDTYGLTANRGMSSFELGGGIERHYNMGVLTLKPGVDFAYQRLSQDDLITARKLVDVGGASPELFQTTAALRSNYFKVTAILGADYTFAPNWVAFAVGRAGVDFIKTDYTGASAETSQGGVTPDNFANVFQSVDHTSGHAGATLGLKWMPWQNVTFLVSGNVDYVGAVPGVVYPAHNVARTTDAAAVNGVNTAGVQYESQVQYGARLGAKVKF